MKKRMVVLLTALAAMACATGVQAKTTEDYAGIEKVKVALIGSASGGNFWGNIETGFNDSIEERGWEGVYWAPSGDNAGQDAGVLDLCETALIQGYNVIVPVMNDITIFEDFLNRANEAGTLIISYNSNPGEEYVISQVGIDSYESGYQQGEKVAEFAKEAGLDEIKYVTMFAVQSNPNQQLTRQGAVDAMEANFDGPVTEITTGESHDNASSAQDAIGAMFIAHSDINAIICTDQMSAVGSAAYIEENSRQGEVIACGLSLDEDSLLRVKSGALSATSSVDSIFMGGEELCGVIENIIAGEEFEYKNFPPKIWVLPDEVDAYAEEHGMTLN